MEVKKRPVYVVGHKNPDRDSICAAIAYARLKKILTGEDYEPARAGHLNEETTFVLKEFGVNPPTFLRDVRTQVRDMEIREIKGLSKNSSLKTAWQAMKDNNVVTLPVTVDDRLIGVISMGDIVGSYMDIYDSNILSLARTSYHNIVEALDGEMLIGDIASSADKGKVVIAAGNPEMMEELIKEGDVVILGNRYEMQLCAIEMGASCLIVCEGADVTKTIARQAEEHNCKIISTPHDTFTVARLINQSLPISYFMKDSDLVTFQMDDYIEDIKQVMAQVHHRYFPVLDENDNYVGMISRRNFLGAKKKKIILVDHNERSQAVNGIEEAELLEIIDHHRLGSVETVAPVYFRNQPLGSTATIVYIMYCENAIEIDKQTAGLLCSAILSDTLLYRSPTCTAVDREAGRALAIIAGIDEEKFARAMFRAGSNLASKTPDEIIHMDFKKFSINDKTVGIGQVNAMGAEELQEIKTRIQPEFDKELEKGFDMVFFMLTNILTESSEVMCVGESSSNVIENAFHVTARQDGTAILEGVVSRKKQLLPAIVESVQQ